MLEKQECQIQADKENKMILKQITENQKETTHTLQTMTTVLNKQSTVLEIISNKILK